LGYARVSSAEQALGTSLQDQQDLIRSYAQKRSLSVDRMYVEAESAVYEKAERRDQVQALLAEARRGDLVLVDKIDRWSRDPEFSYGSIRQLLAKGAAFYAIGDDCDPSTHQGDSMLGMRVFFAREEHKRIRLRMVGTRKLLRDRGYYVEGLPPFGYRRQDVKGIERNLLKINDADAALVKDAYRRCVLGESGSQIARALGIGRNRIFYALKSRVYLGEVKNAAGHWVRGKHDPIIDPKTFSQAQASLERRRNGARVSRDDSETASWWLRDVARCAHCGAKMSSAYAGERGARRYYFRCYKRCTSRFVPLGISQSQAEPLIVGRLIDLREELVSASSKRPELPKSAGVQERRARLERKRMRTIEAFTDGAMTREEMRQAIARLDAERTKLDALEYVPPPITKDERRAALGRISELRRAWVGATPRERRSIVFAIARSCLLAAGKTPRFDWFSSEELARRT
jgi:DNA invertase Pin-like site-specific DNA recombinase